MNVPVYTPLGRRRKVHKVLPAVAALLALGAVALQPAPVHADAVDKAMLDVAPKVMEYLKDKGYKNAGVLKFRVEKGKEMPSLNAGILNTRLSAALQHALILLNDPSHPIGIIEDPGKSTPRGTYLTSKGRRSLVEREYPLSWGTDSARPDVLLTGILAVSKDMKNADLVIRAFTKQNPETIREVARVHIPKTDRALLAGIGQSFVVARGSRTVRDEEGENKSAAENAAKNDSNNQTPLQSQDSPVKLEIYIGDQSTPVGFEMDPATPGEPKLRRSKIDGPAEGQKVKLVITNVGSEDYAVLLAVNGENSLYKQKITQGEGPKGCTKWVLAPNDKYEIPGYYLSDTGSNLKDFIALSKADSATKAKELAATVDPDLVGQISMMVFQKIKEGTQQLKITQDTDLANDVAKEDKAKEDKGSRGMRPRSLQDAQAKLKRATRVDFVKENGKAHARLVPGARSRELIYEAPETRPGATLVRVPFVADPQPIFSLHIRYYDRPAETEENTPTPTGSTPNP
jgi:hypothetical protein